MRPWWHSGTLSVTEPWNGNICVHDSQECTLLETERYESNDNDVASGTSLGSNKVTNMREFCSTVGKATKRSIFSCICVFKSQYRRSEHKNFFRSTEMKDNFLIVSLRNSNSVRWRVDPSFERGLFVFVCCVLTSRINIHARAVYQHYWVRRTSS